MTEPLRNHGDHGGGTAVYAVQAPQWHRASGVTGVLNVFHDYLGYLQSAPIYNYGIMIIIVYGFKYLYANVFYSLYGVDEMPIACVMFSRSSEHIVSCVEYLYFRVLYLKKYIVVYYLFCRT